MYKWSFYGRSSPLTFVKTWGSRVGSTYRLWWCRFPLRSAEPQEVQAVLLRPTSSGLRWKGGVSPCRTGSVAGQDSVPQGVEATPPAPPLDSGLLGSG